MIDYIDKEKILNDYGATVAKLTFDFVLEGRNFIPEININASNLGQELLRGERERVKKYKNYLETSSIEKKCPFLPGKKGICIVKQGSIIDVFSQILVEGYRISEEYQKKLRISIDYTKPSLSDKKHMAWQSAAQVISFNEKSFNITQLRKKMIKDRKLISLLEIDKLSIFSKNKEKTSSKFYNQEKTSDGEGRVIDDVIRLINPKENSKGRPRKKMEPVDQIIIIPGLFLQEPFRINFQKYSFVIKVISKVLVLNNKTYDEIISHPLIKIYKELLPFTFEKVVNFWIEKGCIKSSRIF